MNNKLLLPHRWKRIGWMILIPATIAGIILAATGYEASWLDAKVFAIAHDTPFGHLAGDNAGHYFTWVDLNITNTLVGMIFIIGGLLVAFSKERQEDEFIANLRLSSLLWSVWLNYILLLVCFMFIYGIDFMHVMIYNMFTILIIFIIRFNYILLKNSKSLADEK